MHHRELQPGNFAAGCSHHKAPGYKVLVAGIGDSVLNQGTAASYLVGHKLVVRTEHLGRGRMALGARRHSLGLDSDLGMGPDHAGSRRSVEGHIGLAASTAVIDRIVAVGHTEVVVVGSLAVGRSLGHRELKRRSHGRMGQASRTAGCRIDRRG